MRNASGLTRTREIIVYVSVYLAVVVRLCQEKRVSLAQEV